MDFSFSDLTGSRLTLQAPEWPCWVEGCFVVCAECVCRGREAWVVMEAEHSLPSCDPKCEPLHLCRGLLCAREAVQVHFFLSQGFIILICREGRRRGENSPSSTESGGGLRTDLCPTCPGSLGTFHVNYTVLCCHGFSFGIHSFGKQINCDCIVVCAPRRKRGKEKQKPWGD